MICTISPLERVQQWNRADCLRSPPQLDVDGIGIEPGHWHGRTTVSRIPYPIELGDSAGLAAKSGSKDPREIIEKAESPH
jgi:hypothetical protein